MLFKQFVRLIWKNKHWIILIPLVTALGVYFLSTNLPNQYESSTVIFTNPTSNRGATEGGVIRMDFYTSNNLFDNLTLLVKSRETVKEASMKLMAQHLLLKQPDNRVISEGNRLELRNHIPQPLWEALAVDGDEKATFQNIERHLFDHADSPIDYLLREHPHYSVNKIIDALYVARKASSDMIDVVYRSDDPGICYNTLKFLTETFMERYVRMKEMENINSINYFKEQLVISQEHLKLAEEELKTFITTNRILNYYEQGKYLDIAKLEQDQDEEKAKRLIAGTRSNLAEIEAMFEGFDLRHTIIGNIADIQGEIVARNLQLQGLKMSGQNDGNAKVLEDEIAVLKGEIDLKSGELFKNNNSLQGIQRQKVLDEWLKLKIQHEEQMEALEVMQDRKAYLDYKINEFAPLGAELKKLEREVKVHEDQYLSILHGLNMAYLQKYDLDMSSPQKLIDVPFFPKSPLPSKRKLLTVGGFLGSGFFIFSLVMASYFIDRTIKSKEKAERQTGLKVAGGWINEKNIPKNIYLDSLSNRLVKQFYNNTTKHLPKKDKKIILFYSIKKGEGKSFLIKKLTEEYLDQNLSVIYWGPKGKSGELPYGTMIYEMPDQAYIRKDGFWEEKFASVKEDVVLWELPNIEEFPINFDLINQAHLLVLVLDSGRKWCLSDENYLVNIIESCHIPHLIWLNKMEESELEDLNGEIPKKRSWVRSKVKGIIS